MEAREHHFFFAKKMIPTHAFQSPDKVFSELVGPKREAFLMFLWTEAGKTVAEPLRPVDVGRVPGTSEQGVVKLEVVGAIRQGWTEVIVISMPPALAPNEAIFMALVREGGNVRVFFYERCRDSSGAVSRSEAVLASLSADGTRQNLGFFQGDGLATFKEQVGRAVNVSMLGLENSLPPITMGDFIGGGMAGMTVGAQAANGLGGILEKTLLVRAALPPFFWITSWILRGALAPVVQILYPLLTLAIIGMYLAWLYRIYDARRGRMAYSPGMAVGSWFIPLANLGLAPIVLRDAWKAVRGPEGSGLVFLWWAVFLLETMFRVLFTIGFGTIHPRGSSTDGMLILGTERIPIDGSVASILSYGIGFLAMSVGGAAYGLWWLIVRRINEKA